MKGIQERLRPGEKVISASELIESMYCSCVCLHAKLYC